MTFLTPFFAFAALAAVSIPILLHLLMRGRPKRQLFPALGLLRERHRQNKRRLTLKHLLLLTLRVLAILLLGLALARPSLKSPTGDGEGGSRFAAFGSRSAPVDAAFVFDTSVRMEYRLFNETRLDEAKKIARDLIARLPAESRIAILTPAGDRDRFQVDRLAALEQIDRLHSDAPRRSVAETAAAAVRLLIDSERADREIFLLTDRTEAGWPANGRQALLQALEEEKKSRKPEQSPILPCLIDCAAEPLQDTAIVGLERTPDANRQRSAGRLELELAHLGPAKEGMLELWLIDPESAANPASPESTAEKADFVEKADSGEKAEKSASSGAFDPTRLPGARRVKSEPFAFPDEAAESRRSFTLRLDEPADGFRVGFVRLVPGDALEADNVRYFALDKCSGGRILLVTPKDTPDAALFVREALAPEAYRQAGFAPFDPVTLERPAFDSLSLDELRKYQAIFFLDPSPFDASAWGRIREYVERGGGAGFFLGRRSVPIDAWGTPEAIALLGGRPMTQVRRPNGDDFFLPMSYENGALSAFRPLVGTGEIPWRELPILRHWKFDALDPTSEILLRFTNADAALWTRRLGRGAVMVAATPFSDAPNDPKTWNRLAAGESAWVFLVLTDGIAQSLTGGGGEVLEYEPGQVARLRPQAAELPTSVALTLPDGGLVTVATDLEKREIRFTGTGPVGPYRVGALPNSPAAAETLDAGFCVNWPASEFRLATLPPETLADFWGEIKPRVVKTVQEAESGRHARSVGREIFPLAALLLLAVIVGEAALANRFYES